MKINFAFDTLSNEAREKVLAAMQEDFDADKVLWMYWRWSQRMDHGNTVTTRKGRFMKYIYLDPRFPVTLDRVHVIAVDFLGRNDLS